MVFSGLSGNSVYKFHIIQWKIPDDILSLGGAVENEVFGPPSSTPGQRELMPEQNPLICTKALRVAFKIQDL